MSREARFLAILILLRVKPRGGRKMMRAQARAPPAARRHGAQPGGRPLQPGRT